MCDVIYEHPLKSSKNVRSHLWDTLKTSKMYDVISVHPFSNKEQTILILLFSSIAKINFDYSDMANKLRYNTFIHFNKLNTVMKSKDSG